MEIQHHNYSQKVFTTIVDQCNPQVQMTFLQFLSTEIVLNIALVAHKHKRQEYFYKLALVLVYFKCYLNRVDRSMYYLFYEEKQFTTLEQTFIINIARKTHQTFLQLRNSYETLLARFQQQARCVSDQEGLRNLLQCLFFQTDYPLPACKRQTIGVYCQTPFQQFMSLIRFPLIETPDQYIDPPLEEMRRYFLQENDLNKIVQNIQQKGPQNISKLSLLRYCPHQLRNIQWDQICIQKFQIHNLIVILFQLAITNARASYVVIKQHQDPIMMMAQFVTRANIYKNIVLAIEEKFGFLFQAYGDIFQIVTKGQHCSNLPKFQLWNGAMTIWVQQFQPLQTQLYDSFNYILLRQRQINTINFLAQKSETFPSVYNPLKLQLQKKSLFEAKKEETYKNNGISYQSFFQQNIDSYDILGKDFLEHQIDTSINEFNVHKCGHSEHVIKRVPFFRNFIETVKEGSNNFYCHLQKLIFKKNSDKKMRLGILKDLIKFDLDYIEGKFTKPVILKQVLGQVQELMESLVEKLPEFSVFSEQAFEKFGIHLDFSHKDNLLDYFCAKSETPIDCLAEYRSFYDMYKENDLQQMICLALSNKDQASVIESQIQEECYESSLSNSSILSLQEQ